MSSIFFQVKTSVTHQEVKPLPYYFKKRAQKRYFAITSKDSMLTILDYSQPLIVLDEPMKTLDGTEEDITVEEFREVYDRVSKIQREAIEFKPEPSIIEPSGHTAEA